MVQLARQAYLDTPTGHYRPDMADSLSDHTRQLRFRVRAGTAGQGALVRGSAVWDQPSGQPYVHADPIWDEELAAGGCVHLDRLGHHSVDVDCSLDALSMGGRGPGALFYLGVAGHGAPTVDHCDELGTNMKQ